MDMVASWLQAPGTALHPTLRLGTHRCMLRDTLTRTSEHHLESDWILSEDTTGTLLSLTQFVEIHGSITDIQGALAFLS